MSHERMTWNVEVVSPRYGWWLPLRARRCGDRTVLLPVRMGGSVDRVIVLRVLPVALWEA